MDREPDGGQAPSGRGRDRGAAADPGPAGAAGRDEGAPHLYVHLPFCRSRCAYCDFPAEPIGPHLRAGRVTAFVEALRAELDLRGALLALPLETVYLGGGTPTVLPPGVLLPLVAELGGLLAPGGEFTIEANPGTLDLPLLRGLRAAGVTRLSLGVQSFAPGLLRALGRRVSVEEIESALAAIRGAEWEDWNLDLVFGIPGQDWQTARADLDRAVSSGAPHVSVYDLSYPPSYAKRVRPEVREAAWVFSEAHYADAMSALAAEGYERYEVSAFARPGHRSRHNLAYWRGHDYVGVGPAAVSTIGLSRWTNPVEVGSYLAGEEPTVETLTPAIRLYEEAMLGLRTADGISERRLASVLDSREVDRLVAQGLLQRACGILSVTLRGFDLCTAILARLLREPGPLPPSSTAGTP